MISIKLCVPIYLDKQIRIISEQTNTDYAYLRDLAGWYKGIVLKGNDVHKEGDVIPVLDGSKDMEGIEMLSGTKAVYKFCQERSVQIEPILDVEIPREVFSKCTEKQWRDICTNAARLEERNERLKNSMEMTTSEVINLYNSGLLWQQAIRLESNLLPEFDGHMGPHLTTLNEVGYSLVDGWISEPSRYNNTNVDMKEIPY